MANNKLVVWGIVASIVLSAISLYVAIAPSLGSQSFGSLGVKLAENYDPYLRYNGGYYSALPIQTTSTFTAGGLITASANLKVGSSGTSIARINAGTCYVLAYATTIAASSTAKVDCQATALIYTTNTTNATALTGVTAGDNVVATLATSTAGTTSNGLVITGASASTTAGYIQLNISNLTGGTFTWPTTGAATGTVNYIVTH